MYNIYNEDEAVIYLPIVYKKQIFIFQNHIITSNIERNWFKENLWIRWKLCMYTVDICTYVCIENFSATQLYSSRYSLYYVYQKYIHSPSYFKKYVIMWNMTNLMSTFIKITVSNQVKRFIIWWWVLYIYTKYKNWQFLIMWKIDLNNSFCSQRIFIFHVSKRSQRN